MNRIKRKEYYNRKNEPVTKVVTRTCAVINPAFIKEHNLSKRTKPHEFANIFLPKKSNLKTGPGYFSFEKMMQWTATKAIYADAGNSYYKGEYVAFSIDQIRKHSCAFYIFHGLSPSPRVEYKFNPQRIDPVNGNDFIYTILLDRMPFESTSKSRHFYHYKIQHCQSHQEMLIPNGLDEVYWT